MVASCLKSQQLATGYEKGVTQAEMKLMLNNVPNFVLEFVLRGRYERVKCGYVFNAACQAYMINGLMANEGITETADLLAGMGRIYEESVRLMIATLYNGGIRRLDGLWMMYLHLNQMNAPTAGDSHQQSVKARFSLATVSVLNKLQLLADRSNCDACNEFNAFDKTSSCRRKLDDAAGQPKEIARLMAENAEAVSQMIAANQANGLDTTDAEYFRADALYFDHVLANDDVLDELLGAYDVQVDRADIKAGLASHYKKARQLDLSTDGMASLEAYQLAVIDTLKTVLLRLVWKHLILFNVKTTPLDFINDLRRFKLRDYKKDVLRALDWFAGYFSLQGDRQFLNVYKRLSEPTNSAVKALLKELTRISSTLSCVVTEKPKLGTTVFDSYQMPVTSHPLIDAKLYQSVIVTDEDISKYEKPFSKPFQNILDVCLKHKIPIPSIKRLSEVDEKYFSLISLYVFKNHVQSIFKGIHIEIVRSFQIYSDIDYQSDETISQLEPESTSLNYDYDEILTNALSNE